MHQRWVKTGEYDMNFTRSLAGIFILFVMHCPVHSQDYRGKLVSIYSAGSPGSGHDIYARVLAQHLGKHLSGNPTIVLKPMVGLGGRRAAEYIANQAWKDGTEFGSIHPEAFLAPLYEKQRYGLDSLVPLGSALAGRQLCITAPDSPIKTFSDTDTHAATFGATAIGGSPANYAYMVQNLTRRNKELFRVITGHRGMSNILFAMEQGLIDGVCGLEWTSFATIKPDWIEGPKRAHILLQTGPTAHEPLPVFGYIPDIRDFVSVEDREVVEFIVKEQLMSRPYFAPAGTDPVYVETLRQALAATWTDPAFLEDARRARLEISPVSIGDMQRVIDSFMSAPPSLIERALRAQR